MNRRSPNSSRKASQCGQVPRPTPRFSMFLNSAQRMLLAENSFLARYHAPCPSRAQAPCFRSGLLRYGFQQEELKRTNQGRLLHPWRPDQLSRARPQPWNPTRNLPAVILVGASKRFPQRRLLIENNKKVHDSKDD